MVQVLKIFIYFISIQYINILPTYAIIDPFDPIVNELLAPPIVTVETLSGGNIKTTVAIA
jgi:hypothetical protein